MESADMRLEFESWIRPGDVEGCIAPSRTVRLDATFFDAWKQMRGFEDQ